MNRILFVCTGNTCRSPMAAGIFRSLAKAHPTLRNVVVESAGIGALPDHPASAAAVEVMKGIWDISGHRSQTLGHAHLERSDLVLTMSQDHIFYVQAHHERANVCARSRNTWGWARMTCPIPSAARGRTTCAAGITSRS